MEQYKDMLLDYGIKPTLQRIMILDYLDKNHNHPTADMIFSDLHKQVPTLSKTTVYNTMDIFSEKGLVTVLTFTKTEWRYEINHNFHHHFYCKQCGRIYDVESECEYQKLLVIDGHKIEEISGTFEGICKNCRLENLNHD